MGRLSHKSQGSGSLKVEFHNVSGKVKDLAFEKLHPGVVLVLTAAQIKSSGAVEKLNELSEGLLGDSVRRARFPGEAGSRLAICFYPRGKKGKESLFVRLSAVSEDAWSSPEASLDEWRRCGADAVRFSQAEKLSEVSLILGEQDSEAALSAVLEGIYLSLYQYQGFQDPKAKPDSLKLVRIHAIGLSTKKFQLLDTRARGLAQGVNFAREMVNTPPSEFPPAAFVREAKRIAQGSKGRVVLKVFGKSALQKMKAGCILGISQGSSEEPFLIHAELSPKKKMAKAKRIVLIGKGVTFDSGGLSIKTRPGMESMKCDMAGGAAVLGLLEAVLLSELRDTFEHELHVIVPTAENMINGESLKPGDVVRSVSGTSVEVLNIDAEGRLLLADALGYAARLKPDMIIDLATLTGACAVALGSEYAGVFSDDEPIVERLLQAGVDMGERYWRLPLAKEYRDQLRSPVADLKNMGNEGGPGAIVAALFLKEFVPLKARWAHVDMAGPAFWAAEKEYSRKGASGFGVRSLYSFLENIDGVLASPKKHA